MAEQTNDVMATIAIGYKTYVMSVDAAVAIAKAMASAELYERKYRSNSEGGSTYHVYADDTRDMIDIGFIPAIKYRMAKLAGKPTD